MNLKKVLLGIAISLVMFDAGVWAMETESQRSTVIVDPNKAEHSQKRSMEIPEEKIEKLVPTSPWTPSPSALSGRYTEFVMATVPYVALLTTTAMRPISAFTTDDWRLSRILGVASGFLMKDMFLIPCLDQMLTIQKETNQKLYPDTSFETSGKATALTMVLSILSAKSAWECVIENGIVTTCGNRFFSVLLCGWTWYSATTKYKSFLENFLHYSINPVISCLFRSWGFKDPYSSY